MNGPATSPGTLIAQAIELQRAKRLAEAADLYRQVLAQEPAHAEAWQQLGLIAYLLGQPEDGVQALSRAIQLRGNVASYHQNLGLCLRATGRFADAEASHRRALGIEPQHFNALANLWLLTNAKGQQSEADSLLARVRDARPIVPEERALRGTILLANADFAGGWSEHELRLAATMSAGEVHSTPLPRDPSAWRGRTILVWCEQGLGDTLQMIRYVPLLEEQGGAPIVAVQPALIPLLAESGFQHLIPLDQPAPATDFQVHSLSLPWVFDTMFDSIPASVPYLRPRPELVTAWRAQLASLSGLKVGICWQGNRAHPFDRQRSIPLAQFRALAQVPGVTLISLQTGQGTVTDPAAGAIGLYHFGPAFDAEHGPFMDTAAAMLSLDLVIACDSAIGHLAGALAVPVWVPLSAIPDWRWMVDRDDSPWYPTMRLFRQQTPGDWADVFARIAGDLARLAARKSV